MNIINKKCVSTIIGGINGNVTYMGAMAAQRSIS